MSVAGSAMSASRSSVPSTARPGSSASSTGGLGAVTMITFAPPRASSASAGFCTDVLMNSSAPSENASSFLASEVESATVWYPIARENCRARWPRPL